MAQLIAIILLLGMILLSALHTSVDNQSFHASLNRQEESTVDFDPRPHLRYVRDSQHVSGAFAMTPAHLHINPYFANLGAASLLSSADFLTDVERYLDWYLLHMNPNGSIHDFQIVNDRVISTGCADSTDSTDSYAATFLSLVNGWVKAGGDPNWVRVNMSSLNRVQGAILDVTDRDALTWAKPYYPYKLLMDNCEVYQGWRDWAEVLKRVGLDDESNIADQRADQLFASINRFRSPDGSWAWALTRVGLRLDSYPGRFYPDGVAQLFPLLHGLTDDPSGYLAFRQAHPEWWQFKTTDFPWMLVVQVARLSHDTTAVATALTRAKREFSAQPWPWFITESAWALRAGR